MTDSKDAVPEYCDDDDCGHLTASHNAEGCEDCTGIEQCGLTPQDILDNATPAPPLDTQTVPEWTGSQDPCDPDNFWIDDATGERVSATGERMAHTCPQTVPKACGFKTYDMEQECGFDRDWEGHGGCPTAVLHFHTDRYCHPYQDTEGDSK